MLLRFGSFQIDEQRFELRQGETLINVQPRVFETILFLVKHNNRLVTKEQLIEGPWGGTIVSDTALSQAISQARAALGEDPRRPQFIETVRGRGFRFCGELIEAPPSNEAATEPPRLRPFFGRQREAERLQVAANEARAGHGNVVLIHGPAGVGKTRLAQWFATQQHDAGSEICWGGCREGQAAPPFWPWPELLHRYSEMHDAGTLERLARGLQHDLLAVAPELREAFGATSLGDWDESPRRTLSLLDAMAGFLRRASADAPLTLVLEDLHLADDAALSLIEVIARSIADTELLVVGTFRRAEGVARSVLRSAVDGSIPHVTTIALEGLPFDEVRQWLAATTTTPLPDTVVEALHFSTEGLPVLIEALANNPPDWNASAPGKGRGAGPGLSDRAAQILGRRLDQLDPDTLLLLQTAAVCGEEFPVSVLASASNEPLHTVLTHLDHATELGVLEPVAHGSRRFAHALHQQLLYRRLAARERRQRHALLARAFADQLTQRPESVVHAAHHFLEALPHASLDEALYYAQRAADWARAQHAYARAAEYYQRALDVLDERSADPLQYAELLLALGHTQFVAGAVDDASATLDRSVELTRHHGCYDLFCRAISIWIQLHRESALIDPNFHARVAEALANVREKDVTFAQLQVARAMAMAWITPASERTQWAQEALALTRSRTNPRARLNVLRGALRCYTRFPDGISRLALARELLGLAQLLRSPENELEARQWMALFLLELGHGDEYAQQVSDHAQRAAVVRTAQGTWTTQVHRVGQLFLAGDLSASERIAREAAAQGEKLLGITALVHLVAQLLQLGVELHGPDAERVLEDAQAGAKRILVVAPSYHLMLTVQARAALAHGQAGDAQRYLASVVQPSYVPPEPLDGTCLIALVNIAAMAAELGDADAAAVLVEHLEPHDGLHAVSGTGSVYMGPASYWLGRLCLTLGRHARAAAYLECAREACRSSGAVTYRAWSEYYLARSLPHDPTTAGPLFESAQRTAQRFGLTRLLAQLRLDGVTPVAK